MWPLPSTKLSASTATPPLEVAPRSHQVAPRSHRGRTEVAPRSRRDHFLEKKPMIDPLPLGGAALVGAALAFDLPPLTGLPSFNSDASTCQAGRMRSRGEWG